jgi:hypothetical protein
MASVVRRDPAPPFALTEPIMVTKSDKQTMAARSVARETGEAILERISGT